MKKEQIHKLIFIVPNIVLSIGLIIYYIIQKPIGFIGSVIPSYFFGVVAAVIYMYYIHPKIKSKNKISFKYYNLAIGILTFLVIIYIIYLKYYKL